MGVGKDASSTAVSVGQASAAVAAVLFGTAYVATSFAIRSFTPMGAAMWRGILSTAVLVPAVALTRNPGPILIHADRAWRLIVLGVSGGLGLVVAMNIAISLAGASQAAFAASLAPILAALLAPIVLGEALSIPAVGGFALALVGAVLLSDTATSRADALGVLAGMLAALCFAVFLLLSRRWSVRYQLTGGSIALSIAATTGLGLLPVELLRESGRLIPAHVDPEAVLALIWLGLVPGAAAQLFVVASVRRIKTRSSSALLLINPVTASVLAAALLGEALNGPQLLGAVLILGGTVGAVGLEGQPRLRSAGDRIIRWRQSR